MSTTSQNHLQAPPPPTWRERLRWTLFPARAYSTDIPTMADRPNRDAIIADSHIAFSWADRLRVLMTGRVHVRIKIATENFVGYTKSVSAAHVEAPRWLASEGVNVAFMPEPPTSVSPTPPHDYAV